MSTQNTSLRVAEVDFNSIKNNLKTFLRSQSEFQDFDFDGSGMSILIDLLAYNTHYMGYYLNMVGNEAFLDTAQLRESIISISKLMNYVPRSSQGAATKINIVVTPAPGSEETAAQAVTLDKYTKLLGTDINGVNYPFVTLYSNTSYKVGGSFSFANVNIKQGEVITRQFLMDPQNTRRRFKIPSANVDTSSMQVSVQESSTNTNTTVYSRYDDITEVKGDTPAYFLEEDTDLNYTVYFGDDIIGAKPKIGSVVTITYLDSVGDAANNISKFSFTDRIGGRYSSNVVVTATTPTYGAATKETVEDIRFRAPYHYTVQNRAVTSSDYEALLVKDFPYIESASVWGGEDNDPIVYGKVYISLKPTTNYILTTKQKEEIKETLIRNRNVMTIIPEIVDPDYEYVTMVCDVKYNPQKTSLSQGEITELVLAAISDYNERELKRFNSVFRQSKLQQYIENAERSITGSNIVIYLQKREILDFTQAKNLSIKFNLPLRKGDYLAKLYTFPEIQMKDLEGQTHNVFIEEVPESFTGVESISIENPGRGYTTAPTVTITGDGIGATAVAKIVSGKISNITLTNKGSNYNKATVSIDGGNGVEGAASAVLEQQTGILRIFYYKPNGEKVIINDSAGTINYVTGEITLESFKPISLTENDYYPSDTLTFNIPAESQIITPIRNRIISIDEGDSYAIQLSVEPE